MITIYHNPRCKKSREGLQYLEEKGVDFTIRQYLKDLLSEDEISNLVKKTGLPAKELIRTQEAIYKSNYKGKELSKKEWIKAIAENPKLLHRPIVEKKEKAVLAQPPTKIDEIL